MIVQENNTESTLTMPILLFWMFVGALMWVGIIKSILMIC